MRALGKLTVTIEVKASGTNAGAMLDLFDANSRPLLSDVLAQARHIFNTSKRPSNSNKVSRIASWIDSQVQPTPSVLGSLPFAL